MGQSDNIAKNIVNLMNLNLACKIKVFGSVSSSNRS
jgi:hypothetical protein